MLQTIAIAVAWVEVVVVVVVIVDAVVVRMSLRAKKGEWIKSYVSVGDDVGAWW